MFKSRTSLISIALAMMAAGPLAAAPEFNVDTESADGNATRIWLSYLADSNVTALEFMVELDAPEDVRGNTRDCLASLPKSHSGRCKLDGNVLRGVIFSPTNAALPDTNLGSVLLDPDSMLKAGGEKTGVQVSTVEVSTVNPQGLTVAADVRISGQLAQSGKPGD